MASITLEDALFPTVALEVHKPIYYSGGVVFAAVGDVVLARGRRGVPPEEIILSHPRRGTTLLCTTNDLRDVSVLDEIPA